MPEPARTAELSRSEDNPFQGLQAFEPDRSFLYFGREQQTDELMRRLRGTHFLSVVGTSGSGKSSLVRAGLVPALHSGYMVQAGSSWRVAILRPGGDPIRHLAQALADPAVLGGNDADTSFIETTLRGSSLGLTECVELARIPEHDNVLIVVDQFEELFRYQRGERSADSRDEAVAFVKLLLHAAAESGQIYIVITMRSDFIGDCMEFPRLPEAINEGQYLVPRMTREELRQAITGPVGVRHGKISPRLVARLLNDVGDHADQLPVLQHALMRMWDLWVDTGRIGALDLVHYEEIGTMEEALSRHAEKAFEELESEREREIAERLFKALTETERGGRGIRRPAELQEICAIAGASQSEVAQVIDRFRLEGRSFLMPKWLTKLTPETIIDLSHESLMRNWGRLVTWAKEEAEAAAMYRRLSRAARRYEAGEGNLWRSPELDLGLRWREENRPTAAWAKRYGPKFDRAISFLDESVRERDETAARQKLAQRRKARLTLWATAITGLLVLILGLLWLMIRERDRLQAVSAALNVDDPLLKALVLAEAPERLGLKATAGGLEFEAVRRVAYEMIPEAELREPGRRANDAAESAAESAWTPPPWLTSAALSPDGEWVVTGASDGAARLWRSDGRGDPVALDGHTNEVTSAAFSPDGTRILTSSKDGSVRIWDRQGGPLAELSGRGEATSAAWSPDGERIVTSWQDRKARLWPADGEGEPTVLANGHTKTLAGASFSPDGARVLTFSDDGTARIWDLEGEEPVRLEHLGPVTAAAFHPRGDRVVTASLDGTARIWNLDGEKLLALRHGARVLSASFDGTGDRIVTSSADHAARIWNLAGEELAVMRGHDDRVTSAAFAPDGRLVVTASRDTTARLWSAGGEELQVLRGHRATVNVAIFSGGSASRPLIVTAADDGTARIWPIGKEEPRRLGSSNEVTSVSFSPDGGEVLTSSIDGQARIYRLGSSDVLELTGHRGPVFHAAYSPKGDRVVTVGKDRTVRIWKRDGAGHWDLELRLAGHSGEVTGAAFSPDGREIVTASEDEKARVWNLGGNEEEEPEVLRGSFDPDLRGHFEPITSAAFSPDGDEIVTTSSDKTAWVWKRDGDGSWRARWPLKGHAQVVWAAVFSPGGDRIVTASGDGTARIWKRHELKWKSALVLLGHREDVLGATFSPTGSQVATASKDGTVRIWDGETGRELYLLRVSEPVRDAAFSPDGRYVVTATGWKNNRGAVELWRVTEKDLRKYLLDSTSACLKVEERCQFLGELQWTARKRFSSCEAGNWRTPADPGVCR